MDIDYSKLVEDLEDKESEVECKVCFELFPKNTCIKIACGWLCPRCAQEMISHAGTNLELLDVDPTTLGYDDPRLPEKEEEPEDFEDPVNADNELRKHEKAITEDN